MRRDKVEIMPYQEIWSKQFQIAKQELKFYLGEAALCIHHIGSTSIPGMPSKNRIDIQVGVESISQAKYTSDNRDAYCEIKDPVCDLIMIDAKRWAATH